MVHRDPVREHPEEAVKKTERKESIERAESLERAYHAEFEAKGIQNLTMNP